MSSSEERYFNFPVQLLDGFLKDKIKVLDNIFYYAIYVKQEKLEGTSEARMKAALKYFGVTTGNDNKTLKNGENLFNSIPEGSPMVGIKKEVYFDFYKNYKDDFEQACLLAFLAIKSILGSKPYCKATNFYLWARMCGKIKSISDVCELSEAVRKYANEYQTKKLKTALRENWGLITYSRFTYGFYVSFTLDLPSLIMEAEKRRKSTKEKQYKQSEKDIVRQVLATLNNTS